MPLTPEQWQARVLARVGAGVDLNAPDVTTPNVGLIWDSLTDAYGADLRLQYLYTVRECLNDLAAQARPRISTSAMGVSTPWRERFANTYQMIQTVNHEIVEYQAQVQAAGGLVVGPLAAQSPDPGPIHAWPRTPDDPRWAGEAWGWPWTRGPGGGWEPGYGG